MDRPGASWVLAVFPFCLGWHVHEYVHWDKFTELDSTALCIFCVNVIFQFKLLFLKKKKSKKRRAGKESTCTCFPVHAPREVHLGLC